MPFTRGEENEKNGLCLQSKTLNDFNFNAWKKRYTDWNNSHYLRLTDVFRNKINSRAETLTRKEFIEGILATSNNHLRTPVLPRPASKMPTFLYGGLATFPKVTGAFSGQRQGWKTPECDTTQSMF